MLEHDQPLIHLNKLPHRGPLIKEAASVDVGEIAQPQPDNDIPQIKEPLGITTVHLEFQQDDVVGIIVQESPEAPKYLLGRYRPSGTDAVAEDQSDGRAGTDVEQEPAISVL